MNDLLKALQAFDGGERDQTTPLPEAMIEELRFLAASYWEAMKGCPFRPGDFVTPRRGRGHHIENIGKPHIVLEIFDEPVRPSGDAGTSGEYRRLDMRVAYYRHDNYHAAMAESWEYESYQPLGET